MKKIYYINKKNYTILSNHEIRGGFKKKHKKATNKKINRANVPSEKPLNLFDWISYVEDNNLQLKMDDLKKMKPGESIKIVASIIQSRGEDKWKLGDIVDPIDYFADDVVTFTYPNILNGIEYKYEKSQFDPANNPAEHDPVFPFYDDGDGNAVLGSGG